MGSKAYITDHTTIEVRGEALGFIDTARNLGAVFGTFILGWLASLFTIQQAMGAMSVFAFTAFIILFFRIPKDGSTPSEPPQ